MATRKQECERTLKDIPKSTIEHTIPIVARHSRELGSTALRLAINLSRKLIKYLEGDYVQTTTQPAPPQLPPQLQPEYVEVYPAREPLLSSANSNINRI